MERRVIELRIRTRYARMAAEDGYFGQDSSLMYI